MNKLLYFLCLFILLFVSRTIFADNNFLNGIVRTQLSTDFHDNMAAAGAIEVGPRNYRASGTFGLAMNPANRIKLTGEWLWQDIDYNFIVGTSREWVQQAAVGIDYQLALYTQRLSTFDFSAYYSHAPSKDLISIDFLDIPSGSFFSDVRRIAGSDAGGVSPSVAFPLWRGAEASLALNWDSVSYDNELSSDEDVNGFGGTLGLTQTFFMFNEEFTLNASAAIRAPFNFYTLGLDWVHPLPTSQLWLGMFANAVQGKEDLPDTGLFGFNIAYAIDTPSPQAKPDRAVKADSLLAWVNKPAVYMPQVLAIAEESVNTCIPGSEPAFRGMMQNLDITNDLPFDISHRFTGNKPLHFTITGNGSVQIDATTGVITGGPATDVVVTATGPCGPAVSTNSFDITP